MRIKVLYNENEGLLRIPAVLWTPHKRIVSDIVIDTGTPVTILNHTDAMLLNISRTKKAGLLRMGGNTYQSYIYNRFEIAFKNTEGKEVREQITIRIAKPKSNKIKELEKLDFFPNLMGLDFLNKGYKLVLDFKKKEFYLEK